PPSKCASRPAVLRRPEAALQANHVAQRAAFAERLAQPAAVVLSRFQAEADGGKCLGGPECAGMGCNGVQCGRDVFLQPAAFPGVGIDEPALQAVTAGGEAVEAVDPVQV